MKLHLARRGKNLNMPVCIIVDFGMNKINGVLEAYQIGFINLISSDMPNQSPTQSLTAHCSDTDSPHLNSRPRYSAPNFER